MVALALEYHNVCNMKMFFTSSSILALSCFWMMFVKFSALIITDYVGIGVFVGSCVFYVWTLFNLIWRI